MSVLDNFLWDGHLARPPIWAGKMPTPHEVNLQRVDAAATM